MKLSCCIGILLCLAAFTLVDCRSNERRENDERPDNTCSNLKYIFGQALNLTSEICACQLSTLQANLTQLKEELRAISSLLFYPPYIYNNKKYLISNFPHNNVTDAMLYCAALGGYLAEFDDLNEYQAMQTYLSSTPAILVVIGGSDAGIEGNYVYPRTGRPVPFLDWAQNQPDNQRFDEDCLSIWKTFQGKLNDLPCGFRDAGDRFMCEIPNNF